MREVCQNGLDFAYPFHPCHPSSFLPPRRALRRHLDRGGRSGLPPTYSRRSVVRIPSPLTSAPATSQSPEEYSQSFLKPRERVDEYNISPSPGKNGKLCPGDHASCQPPSQRRPWLRGSGVSKIGWLHPPGGDRIQKPGPLPGGRLM